MTTSSAVPADLVRYAKGGRALDADLRSSAGAASEAVGAFRAARPEFGAGVGDPAADAVTYGADADELDAWVGRVGDAFRRADAAAGGWWGALLWFALPPGTSPVTVDDRALDGTGWPTHRQAAAAGAALADQLAPHLRDASPVAADRLEAWASQLALHEHDPAFTVAFFERLGVDATLRIPLLVERSYPMDEYGHPEWGLNVLRPFGEALAEATDTRRALVGSGQQHDAANAYLPDAYRLDERFVDGLVTYRPGYGADDPEAYHQSLLFSAGVFPADVLVRLADNVVSTAMDGWQRRMEPLHLTPFGPIVDPVANVLAAVARNQEASARWLEEPFPGGDTNLELLLARYSNDLDGDGGRAAAEVLRQALAIPDPERATALFEATMAAVNKAGGIRNAFAEPVLVDATVRNMALFERLASDEGGEAETRLTSAHDYLVRLLGDDAAAARIYDAAMRDVYDAVGRARPGDTMGSEAWHVGSLLGLLLAADSNADLSSTKDRIARRQALLDGISQITDLGLTFVPGGKWMPFATAGRDKLLDGFAIDGQLDEALARRDVFEAKLRFELTAVFAVRLAASGQLAVPAGVPLQPVDRMTDRQRAAFIDWVNSDKVRDAVGDIRTQAGQRMDEVERVLPDAG